ncbi:unnamed protein product [Phyllotreta striolata]|uniref:Nuclear condensin complex subunit 3 C-terminal domain-containing protein n=1 Tax=Phyllotreta striolata TaxID=444603 RepID=A0A9N9TJL2_PHYSR|nr:unnamed protein product [Phyllotreta striolata]
MDSVGNERLTREIYNLFSSGQQSTSNHEKNTKKLKQIYKDSNHEEFFASIKVCLQIFLQYPLKHAGVDKVMKLFCKFCAVLHGDHPLLEDILNFLLKTCVLIDNNIRIRSCTLIYGIIEKVSDLSETLMNNLQNVFLNRLYDPKLVIKEFAILILSKFQESNEDENEIILQFKRLMNNSGVAKVRQLCIENIRCTNSVLPCIINRIRDVNVNVRLAAFKRLSYLAEHLKNMEKRLVLNIGFADESVEITNYITKVLLKSWLESYNNDIVMLLKSLKGFSNENEVNITTVLYKKIVESCLKCGTLKDISSITLNEHLLIPIDQLSVETACIWRTYIKFLKESKYDEVFENTLPELIFLSEHIKDFYLNFSKECTSEEVLSEQIILKELFMMIKLYTFADSVQRNYVKSLIFHILLNVQLRSDVIEVIIAILEYSSLNIETHIKHVCEIISDLLYPTTEHQISALAADLTALQCKQDEAIKTQDRQVAERLKTLISDIEVKLDALKKGALNQSDENLVKTTDFAAQVKCIDIFIALLLSPSITALTSSIKTLKSELVEPMLLGSQEQLKIKALKAYALCSIMDKNTAKTGIHILMVPISAYSHDEECDIDTLIVCISAVSDLLVVHGAQLLAIPDTEKLSESMDENELSIFTGGTSLKDIAQGLFDLLDDDNSEIQQTAGSVICRLVKSDIIMSSSVISRLILKWAVSTTSDVLRHVIGKTLEHISKLEVAKHLEKAFFTTVKTLFSAPKNSPLTLVKIEDIAKFILDLKKTSPGAKSIALNIATGMIQEIIIKPQEKINLVYSKLLLMIDDVSASPKLQSLLDELIECIEEEDLAPLLVRNLNKVVKTFRVSQELEQEPESEQEQECEQGKECEQEQECEQEPECEQE